MHLLDGQLFVSKVRVLRHDVSVAYLAVFQLHAAPDVDLLSDDGALDVRVVPDAAALHNHRVYDLHVAPDSAARHAAQYSLRAGNL